MCLTPEILSLLEFDKLREIISCFSFSILGKESILSLIPIENREERKQAISLIREFRSLLNSTRAFPTPQDKDIRSILIKVKEGVYSLPSEELIAVGEVTKDYKAVGLYFSKLSGEYKCLKGLCSFSRKLPDVYERVQKVFDENGEIKDSASKELKSIRTGFRKSHKKLLNAASKLVPLKKRFLQEEIFTTKEERIVLPVLVSKKKNVPGIVHSISQTQNTIFVEPIELVELNNDCTTRKLEEEREIKKILGTITKEIRDNLEYYERSIEEIRQIDKLYGIASFSKEYSLSVPIFSDKPYINIRGGRHPLLLIKKGKDGVVPFDIELGKESKMLLVSGPNMGGKTVLLKSIGIIILMAYSGVLIPAMEDSIIPDIDAIYADIGDEQSIELDLSTFSSHIRNIATALRDASDKSLVLIDEVGVGTDPEEGMGIAMAALERLVKKRSLTFATTHYGKLKHFVAGKENMVNASMDFDVERGVPTYHLSLGIPGASHGFAIAEKMGFPVELIEKAKSYIDKNQIKADELICSLEELTRKVEIEKKIVDEKKRQLEPLLAMFEEKYGEIKRREKELLKEAKQRAEEMVYSTRKEMENLVKAIRESQASKESIKKAKDVMEKKIEQFKESKKSIQTKDISIGDNVYSEKLKVTGKVIEVLDGYVKVETTNFRFLAPFETLRSQKAEKKEDNHEIVFSETKELDSKIDIRGMLSEEAEKRLLEFIDEAILLGLSDIQIIHGKGGGVLREKVSLLLKDDKRIEEYRLGYWNEGGSGVTYVKLKS